MRKILIIFTVSLICVAAAGAQRANLSSRTSSIPRSVKVSRTVVRQAQDSFQPAELPIIQPQDPLPVPILIQAAPQPVQSSNDMIFESAIENVRENCSGIAYEFDKMKTMAGINTAVTGTGTLAGGGAVATGFTKSSKDAQAEKIEIRLEELRKIEEINPASSEFTQDEIDDFTRNFDEYSETAKSELQKMQEELDKLNKQSKNLGNWRTGLMAGSTATNIAGAIMAGNNKASTDLKGAIEDCKNSVKDLSRIYEQNRDAVNASDTEKLSQAEKIISKCGKWESADLSKIDNRSTSSMWFSIAGATTGLAGTITSATANTDKTREGDANREKNLNTASNVLAIGTTATSLTATILNAARISAIIKVSEIADDCEGVLK